jgi:hypothetical protein
MFAGTNAVTAPDTATYPTIGQPFNVVWDPTGMTGPVTLTLLSGCPANCVAVDDIATNVANTGTFAWTPACTLTADTTAEGYGIKMTDETLCKFQYSGHFGLNADTAGACGAAASSAASSAASPTSTAVAASTTTTATTTTTGASSPTSLVTSTVTGAGSNPTGGSGATGGGSGSGAAPTLTQTSGGASSGPGATASLKPQSGDASARGVSLLSGAAAIFGAALLL